MKSQENKVIPPPVQTQFFLPVSFWVKIISHLDAKVNLVAKDPGYGKVNLSITIAGNEIRDIVFSEEIRMRGLIQHKTDTKT